MDTKWQELISERTSSPAVQADVSRFFSNIPEYDDPSDFQGVKSGIVRNITDLMVGRYRAPGVREEFPFDDVSSVLALMGPVAEHRRKFPNLYSYSLVPEDLRLDMSFEDGFEIHELATPESVLVMIDWEDGGKLKAFESAPTSFWTLVDREGHHVASFATSATVFFGINLHRPTTASVHAHVLDFIDTRKLSLLHPCALAGMVRGSDGAMHFLSTLPPGITIDGDLTVPRTFQRVEQLPHDMTVKGNLTITGSRSLVSLPENLTVGGNLRVAECEKLVSIGAGTSVGGDATLYGNPSLSVVGRGCTFGGDLRLDSRRLLTQDFNLRGDAIIGFSKDAQRVAYPLGLVARVLRGRF